ncbi:hypothetical protein ABPG72_005608 [Tetrahymena utriculariae]
MRLNRDSSNESLYSQEDFYDNEFIKKRLQSDKTRQYGTPKNQCSIEGQQIGYQKYQFINNNGSIDLQNFYVKPDQNDYCIQLQKQQEGSLYSQNQDSEQDHNIYQKFQSSVQNVSHENLYKNQTLIFDINSARCDSQNQMINQDLQFSFSSYLCDEKIILKQIEKFNISEYSSILQQSNSYQDLSYSYSDISSSLYSLYEEFDELSDINQSKLINRKSFEKKRNNSFQSHIPQYDSSKIIIKEQLFSEKSNLFVDTPYILHYIGKINNKLNQDSSSTSESLVSSLSQLQQLDNSLSKDQFYREKQILKKDSQIGYEVFKINKQIRKKRFKVQADSLKSSFQTSLSKLIYAFMIKYINEKCYEKSNQNKYSLIFGERIKQLRKFKAAFNLNYHQKCSLSTLQEVKQFIQKNIKQIFFQTKI